MCRVLARRADISFQDHRDWTMALGMEYRRNCICVSYSFLRHDIRLSCHIPGENRPLITSLIYVLGIDRSPFINASNLIYDEPVIGVYLVLT